MRPVDVDSLLQSSLHSVCRSGSGRRRIPACSGCGGRFARGWRGCGACMAAHSQGRGRTGRWSARSRCGPGLRAWSCGGGSGAGHDAQAGCGWLAAWRRPTAAHLVRCGCGCQRVSVFLKVSTTRRRTALLAAALLRAGRVHSGPHSVDCSRCPAVLSVPTPPDSFARSLPHASTAAQQRCDGVHVHHPARRWSIRIQRLCREVSRRFFAKAQGPFAFPSVATCFVARSPIDMSQGQ